MRVWTIISEQFRNHVISTWHTNSIQDGVWHSKPREKFDPNDPFNKVALNKVTFRWSDHSMKTSNEMSKCCSRRNVVWRSVIVIQYDCRERSDFKVSCMNISFFLCNKASKLAWMLRGIRKDYVGIFIPVVGNFFEKLENGHAWCIKFAAYSWRSIFSTLQPKVTRGMLGEPFTSMYTL